ncbi:Putative membrane protein YkgB OS=Streptomyces griseomycini OX=66895 GN=FHS37_007720 PE=4 SV=1 [Streptomyces griseomycini]|nr:hypothetical protein GCM10015536_73960 [Streptomyces griseomycini]
MPRPSGHADNIQPAADTMRPHRWSNAVHSRLLPLAQSYQRSGPAVLRVSVGIVFCWFGFLKFFPGASAAENIAVKAVAELTLGLIPDGLCLPLLALLETAIGLCLVTGRLLRIALAAFFCHMAGVFTSLTLLAGDMWHAYGLVPTLEGQYVIKNIVLFAAGLFIAADDLTR